MMDEFTEGERVTGVNKKRGGTCVKKLTCVKNLRSSGHMKLGGRDRES